MARGVVDNFEFEATRATQNHYLMLLLLLGVVWYAWCQCVGESDEETDAPSEMYS